MNEETTTQWPCLDWLHYKFCLKASRVHVVLILPPAFHCCHRGKRATEFKLLPRVEWA